MTHDMIEEMKQEVILSYSVHPGLHLQSKSIKEEIARPVLGLFIEVIPMSMKCCLWKQRGAILTLPVLFLPFFPQSGMCNIILELLQTWTLEMCLSIPRVMF